MNCVPGTGLGTGNAKFSVTNPALQKPMGGRQEDQTGYFSIGLREVEVELTLS